MSGKLVGLFILIISAIAGAGLYYLQVYAFYERIDAPEPVLLTSIASGEPEEIIADGVTAIDADSSPIRYRACFETSMDSAMLTESYALAPGATPLTAPEWFDCFNAQEIGDALANGTALAFMGQENIAYGVDRLVAILDDGRGFVWHELNDCGRKAYDGTQVGPECPPREGN